MKIVLIAAVALNIAGGADARTGAAPAVRAKATAPARAVAGTDAQAAEAATPTRRLGRGVQRVNVRTGIGDTIRPKPISAAIETGSATAALALPDSAVAVEAGMRSPR